MYCPTIANSTHIDNMAQLAFRKPTGSVSCPVARERSHIRERVAPTGRYGHVKARTTYAGGRSGLIAINIGECLATKLENSLANSGCTRMHPVNQRINFHYSPFSVAPHDNPSRALARRMDFPVYQDVGTGQLALLGVLAFGFAFAR